MSACSLTMRINADSAGAVDLMRQLLAELGNAPLEISQAFVHGFQALAQPFRIDDYQGLATGADEVCIVLQPSRSFLDLVAAFRAGDLDGMRIQAKASDEQA